jgi:hypothetical protein
MHKEAISVSAPEPAEHAPEVIGAHIIKKYGKYHGHIEMQHPGGNFKHEMPPQATLIAAHQTLGEHLQAHGTEMGGKAEPNNLAENAEMPEHEGEVA